MRKKPERVLFKCECGKEFDRTVNQVEKVRSKYGGDFCRSCLMRKQYETGRQPGDQKFWKSKKGITLEEMYGTEKAAEMKAAVSRPGSLNPNFGGTFRGRRIQVKGCTFEEVYGPERAAELKAAMSERMRGEKNHMFGRPTPMGSGSGWSGWFDGFHFRSLLELSFMKRCKDRNITVESAESLGIKIPYIDWKGDTRNYFPDFVVCGYIIEIKPSDLLKSVDNVRKFEAARQFFDHRFKVFTEKNIDKLSNDEILSLYLSGQITFVEKYDIMFKERYLQ